MRGALVMLVVGAACGRIGFDPIASSANDASPLDDGLPPKGALVPPALACSETKSVGAAELAGSGLAAVATARGLAALWLDAKGVLRGMTWKTGADGTVIAQGPVELEAGPFTRLWAAANDDAILVATQGNLGVTGRVLNGALVPIQPSVSLGTEVLGGRAPIARRRGGPGFVAIATPSTHPVIYELDGTSPPVAHPLEALVSHAAPSIAADADSYAVVTEYADQYGPGCWYSKVDDTFAIKSGPGYVESTQQADCDSSTLSGAAGPMGVGITWMDRDPINSYVEFRGTVAGGNVASMSGELEVRLPSVTTTSTGFAVLYRSTAGLRVFDGAGTHTLAPAAGLADLVTWADRAIAVWASTTGAPQLTRLCP